MSRQSKIDADAPTGKMEVSRKGEKAGITVHRTNSRGVRAWLMTAVRHHFYDNFRAALSKITTKEKK